MFVSTKQKQTIKLTWTKIKKVYICRITKIILKNEYAIIFIFFISFFLKK
jgi:hypothetical protein